MLCFSLLVFQCFHFSSVFLGFCDSSHPCSYVISLCVFTRSPSYRDRGCDPDKHSRRPSQLRPCPSLQPVSLRLLSRWPHFRWWPTGSGLPTHPNFYPCPTVLRPDEVPSHYTVVTLCFSLCLGVRFMTE